MKRRSRAALMVVAILSFLFATAGCAPKKTDGGGGGTTTIVQQTPGTSTPIYPGGPITIHFTGQNNYYSGPVISAGQVLTTQSYFVDPGYGAWQFFNNQRQGGSGTVSITNGPVNISGQAYTSVLSGTSGFDPNTSMSIVIQPVGGDGLHYNILGGSLTVSQNWIQRVYGGAIPQVIGLTIDVGVNGNRLGAGGVLIYNSVDAAGYHGAFLAF